MSNACRIFPLTLLLILCLMSGRLGAEISLGDAQTFAELLEWAVADADGTALGASLDDESMKRSSVGILKLSEKSKSVTLDLDWAELIGGALTDKLAGGGSFRLLRVRDDDGQIKLLYRLATPNWDYLEARLEEDAGGEPKIIDLLWFSRGITESERMHRLCLPYAARDNFAVIAKLPEFDRLYIKHLRTINRMDAYTNKQDHRLAMGQYRMLPREIQTDRSFLNVRYNFVVSHDTPKIRDVIQAMHDSDGNHPSTAYLAIIAYQFAQEYDLMLDAIRQFDTLVGGDPYMKVKQAEAYYGKDDLKTALEVIDEAIDALPDVIDAHTTKLTLVLQTQDYQEVTNQLDILQTQFGSLFTDADLRGNDAFNDYVKSRYYREWLKARSR